MSDKFHLVFDAPSGYTSLDGHVVQGWMFWLISAATFPEWEKATVDSLNIVELVQATLQGSCSPCLCVVSMPHASLGAIEVASEDYTISGICLFAAPPGVIWVAEVY